MEYGSLREKIAAEKIVRQQRNEQFVTLFACADAAGKVEAELCKPRPMIVKDGKQEWFVADGVCGFAWIKIMPGNCPFANWLKKEGKASKAYGGGVDIWVSDYNQSMQLKEAYARGFAKVISQAGIKAYAGSRMD